MLEKNIEIVVEVAQYDVLFHGSILEIKLLQIRLLNLNLEFFCFVAVTTYVFDCTKCLIVVPNPNIWVGSERSL